MQVDVGILIQHQRRYWCIVVVFAEKGLGREEPSSGVSLVDYPDVELHGKPISSLGV
jgi:hypothetical protein